MSYPNVVHIDKLTYFPKIPKKVYFTQTVAGKRFQPIYKRQIHVQTESLLRCTRLHHLISLRMIHAEFDNLGEPLIPQAKQLIMPATPNRPSGFLLFPWGLLSIVLILVINLAASETWFGQNWSWITLVLIVPAAIFENFKVGYSTMRIMFLKVIYSLLSFLLVGMAFGAALAGWHLEKFQNITNIEKVKLPWFVLLALVVMLLIQIAQLFSMLKAVKREFMQLDPDQ